MMTRATTSLRCAEIGCRKLFKVGHVSKAIGGIYCSPRCLNDSLCRAVVMIRAGAARLDGNTGPWFGPCEWCGHNHMLQWSHFVTRRSWALRWSLKPRNSYAHCKGCHRRHAHDTPGEFTAWVESKLGAKDYAALRLILKTPRRPDVAAVRVALEHELRKLR